jgi:hypothetical protein
METCHWCKEPAHIVSVTPLDWCNLIEFRGYHDNHVCTARYRGSLTPQKMGELFWAGVETYRSSAHEVRQQA